MEDYLQYMRTLRSHINDVEDQAAKISVEEQMQITTFQTITKEIDFAKSETKRLKEESDLMNKAKGNICSQILERQRKIASLESDSSTQLQTLELIQQERVNLSTKLAEKRTSYGKIKEDLNTKLKEQQDWLNSHKSSSNLGTHSLVNTQTERSANESAGDFGALTTSESLVNAYKDTMTKFDAAKAMFDNLAKMRSEHTSERDKAKQALESLKGRMNSYKPELREMPNETLEEEIQVLMSDKCAETKYQESLQNQIDTIKGISHTVQCGCGEVYKVEVDPCV